MLVSVVVPLYNKRPYVAAAVQSVLNQTYRNLEVLVVDDGSTDGGAEELSKLKDGRLRVIAQRNAGVAAARNRGIELAGGELVCFLDADDWHHPKYVEALAAMARQFPEHGVFATRYRRIPDEQFIDLNWEVSAAPGVEFISSLPREWRLRPTFFTGSVAARVSLLRSLPHCFPVGESMGEDLDLWFRLGEQSIIVLDQRELAAYRVEVSGALSGGRGSLKYLPFMQRMEMRVQSDSMPLRLRRDSLRFLAEHRLTIARGALQRGQRIEAMGWLVQAWRAAVGRRWWLTLAMTCLFSGRAVRDWEVGRRETQ